jgi:hypothetical protein
VGIIGKTSINAESKKYGYDKARQWIYESRYFLKKG